MIRAISITLCHYVWLLLLTHPKKIVNQPFVTAGKIEETTKNHQPRSILSTFSDTNGHTFSMPVIFQANFAIKMAHVSNASAIFITLAMCPNPYALTDQKL